MIKLQKKEAATLYHFENGDTLYQILCVDGIVSSIEKRTVEYYDCGDVENGPKLGSDLSEAMSMETSNVVFERDLESNIELILKDAEAYTLYCMQAYADYSGM